MGTTCTLHARACTCACFFVRWTLTLRSLYVRCGGIFSKGILFIYVLILFYSFFYSNLGGLISSIYKIGGVLTKNATEPGKGHHGFEKGTPRRVKRDTTESKKGHHRE